MNARVGRGNLITTNWKVNLHRSLWQSSTLPFRHSISHRGGLTRCNRYVTSHRSLGNNVHCFRLHGMGGKRGDIMCPVCEEEKLTFNIAYWDMNVCIQNRLQGNCHIQLCNILNYLGKKTRCYVIRHFFLKRKVKLLISPNTNQFIMNTRIEHNYNKSFTLFNYTWLYNCWEGVANLINVCLQYKYQHQFYTVKRASPQLEQHNQSKSKPFHN